MGGNTANLVEEIRTTKTKLVFTSEAIITAHATFNALFNSYLALSEQFDGKFKELELREAAVQQWENEVQEKSQKVEEREKICVEREKNLEDREKRVDAKESQWIEKEKKMQQIAEQLPTVIQMNVCGKRFAAPKEIFLKHKGSLFEQMMTSNHPQQLPTGEIFIGRDPKYFRHVFNFLLDGRLPVTSNEKKLPFIANEFKHFHVPFELYLTPSSPDNMLDEGMFSPTIQSWFPKKKFQLLYKASREGFESLYFHKLCDNKGPTLTVIRSSEGYLFGGFTPLHWDCSKTWKYDTKSFIFTLTNPHNIPPTKYPHNQLEKCAIYCGPSFGPCFGAGCDIYITDNSHKTNENYTRFPSSYTDSTGKGEKTFTGNHQFTANEIEVFSVI